jgi:hypothetical protein
MMVSTVLPSSWFSEQMFTPSSRNLVRAWSARAEKIHFWLPKFYQTKGSIGDFYMRFVSEIIFGGYIRCLIASSGERLQHKAKIPENNYSRLLQLLG